MSKAILTCGPSGRNLDGFDHIWALGDWRVRQLRREGLPARSLSDVSLPPGLDAEIRSRVEKGLFVESDRGLHWATIAFQHVHWRFVRYYQYKLRIGRLLDDSGIGELFVTSRRDSDLIHAADAACALRDVQLTIGDGPCDPFSSLLSYLATYDLPDELASVEAWTSRWLAAVYRLRDVRVFYQPYNNLEYGYRDVAALTWRRSICFPGRSLGKHPFVNLSADIIPQVGKVLDPSAWPGFDERDLVALNSAWLHFSSRYATAYLGQVSDRMRRFFQRAKARRVVLNADNTCSARIIAHAAAREGMQVDYLPHGLIWEDMACTQSAAFAPQRILAWNAASRDRYARSGLRSVCVAHPYNVGPVARKRRFPRELSRLRVLVMPPEWVGLSFGGRMDCFERDLADVLDGLAELGVSVVHVKCHHSLPEVVQAKESILRHVRASAPVEFTVVDSATSSRHLLESYDLAIIGPTTGLLEASRSSTPFVAYRAFIGKAGLFDGYHFPEADSPEALADCILNYDFDRLEDECRRLNESLRQGPSPLSAELE